MGRLLKYMSRGFNVLNIESFTSNSMQLKIRIIEVDASYTGLVTYLHGVVYR